MRLADFVPPILEKARRRLARADTLPVYQSYNDALQDCSGYEDPELVAVVARKTELLIQKLAADSMCAVDDRQTVQNLLILGSIERDQPLEVLEIGGACGASFFQLNHLLPDAVDRWHIYETRAMAEAGAKQFQNEKLTFCHNLEAATAGLERRTLLIAQGVLQYTPDPQQLFEGLLRLGFGWVYVTRTAVSIGVDRRVITKQCAALSAHGPGPLPPGFTDRKTTQPITYLPFDSLCAQPPGYRRRFSFRESEDTHLRVGASSFATRTIGFLLEKTQSSDHHELL